MNSDSIRIVFSVRNLSRELACKYVLYEFLEYFKDNETMKNMILPKDDYEKLFSMMAISERNITLATQDDLKINNILANLIPKEEGNPFTYIHDEKNDVGSELGKTVTGKDNNKTFTFPSEHPSIVAYTNLCSAIDIYNADLTKDDRARTSITIPQLVYKDTVYTSSKGDGYDTLEEFNDSDIGFDRVIRSKALVVPYSCAITTNDNTIFNYEKGKITDPMRIICSTTRDGSVNINDMLRNIASDKTYEFTSLVLNRKLVLSPVLNVIRDADLLETTYEAETLGDITQITVPKNEEDRMNLIRETFRSYFCSISPPELESNIGVIELIKYVKESLVS